MWLGAVYLVNTFLLMAIAVQEVKRPGRALVWIVLDLLLPLLGFVAYLVLSRPLKIRRQFPNPAKTNLQDTGHCDFEGWGQASQDIAQAMQNIIGLSPLPGQVQVLTDGAKTYSALLKSLQTAHTSIDIEYYIFRDDHVGRLITNTLLDKAQKGVRIRFLRDGLGSRGFPKRLVQEMMQAGIECKTFFPVHFPSWITTINHRDHCKIVVIDHKEGFVGGINIGDEYLGLKAEIGPWRDTHLRLVGNPARELESIFQANWQIATADKSSQFRPRTAPQRLALHKQLNLSSEMGPIDSDSGRDYSQSPPFFNSHIQTVQSGPDSRVHNIHELFFFALTMARSRVEITTPYFVPDTDLVVALKAAARRGVNVRMLVPLQPDHKIIALASQTYYVELLQSGVTIYRYQSGVLHAKVVTVDKELAIVGAANFDIRSFRLNYEVCEILYCQGVTEELVGQFERDLAVSEQLTLEQAERESLGKGVAAKGARILAQWL